MLIVIIGTDSKERAKVRHKYAPKQLEELDSNIPVEEIASLAGTAALFGDARAFFLRGALGDKTETADGESRGDALLAMAKGFADSPHLFVFEEEKVLTKPLEKLKKAGAVIEQLAAEKKKNEFNVFALADALARGDRKQLWLLLTRAFQNGVSPENIAGVLAWKARSACATTRSAAERARYEKLSRDIVVLYHESRRGAGDLELLLERFALTL